MAERPSRGAQFAHLVLMWCDWMNVSWDDLTVDQKHAIKLSVNRTLDEELPRLAAVVFGVPA